MTKDKPIMLASNILTAILQARIQAHATRAETAEALYLLADIFAAPDEAQPRVKEAKP